MKAIISVENFYRPTERHARQFSRQSVFMSDSFCSCHDTHSLLHRLTGAGNGGVRFEAGFECMRDRVFLINGMRDLLLEAETCE